MYRSLIIVALVVTLLIGIYIGERIALMPYERYAIQYPTRETINTCKGVL